MNSLRIMVSLAENSQKNFQGSESIFDFGHPKNVHFSKVPFSFRKNLDFLNPYHDGHNFFE